ncbi:glycine/betaine ABC transporter substrate-binding protein [Litorivicinus lipolyticus]|uniref:Glycine/betaine ABC transporter substrate-binding protein n=1 Tax=Litorivicinus lipolyticus TaxID=418701 RepID=A0A5Q2QEG6_9GAMM|nr:glycine betaine ABC transporter substrate-binding protein [Litorivicinus lipolyticus]QGG80416.1 glycine/betaine ABC transporter substrate-binding protein [Litorivicinus lipolyticus]
MNNVKLKSSVLAVAMAASGAAYADCGEVSIGAMGWASGETISALAAFVMEQGYGCSVSIVPTDTVPAVTSLAENGQPDVVPEVWINSAPVYFELEAEGKIISASNTFANGGEEGWWVPKYLTDAHPELATIEGILANPELVDNRFHNCPVGWGCRVVNDNLKVVLDMEANGLEIFDHGSGANLAASIASAFEDKAPWFGYYWGPTAVLGKYEMTKVNIGDVNPEQHAINQKADADPAQLGVSGFPAAPIKTAITADFAAREPAVADFVANMALPNDLISKMLFWKQENNASADEAAAWVLTNYTDMIMGMVNDDARAKLGKLL